MRPDIAAGPPPPRSSLSPAGGSAPTAAYFRVGHLVLDSLIRSLPPSDAPAMITATPDEHHNGDPSGMGTSPARPVGNAPRAQAFSSGEGHASADALAAVLDGHPRLHVAGSSIEVWPRSLRPYM